LVFGSAAVLLLAVTAISVVCLAPIGEDRQDPTEVPVQVEEPPVPASPPAVAAEEVEAAMKAAAAETAKRLDGEFRLAHSAKKLIEPAQLNVDLIQALAQGDLDAIPDSLPAEPASESSESYQSLYDSLYNEALAYLRENISREEFTQQAVRDAVQQWEQAKRAALEQELAETLEKTLGPGRQPR
jgi:hypothetical protein